MCIFLLIGLILSNTIFTNNTLTHTNQQMRKRVKYTDTQPHFWKHAPHSLTPTQSRILSDPQLHQQRTKSRLKRVKSCSSVLFKISFFFLSSNNWTSSSSSHIFTYFAHTHIHHKPLRLQNTHMLKSGFEMREGNDRWLSSVFTHTNTDTQYKGFRFFFNFSFRFQSVAIFTIFAPIF